MDMDTNITGMRTMLRFITRKLVLNRRWMVVVLISMFLAAVMGYAGSLSDDPLYDGSDLLFTLMLSFLMPILALIYGASMIRNEIDDRSITAVVSSPVDRRVSYLGYYISLSVVLVLMLVIVEAVGSAAFFALAGYEDGAVTMLLGYTALLIIGAFVYSALFLAMGVLLKQPIYLGLIYAFIWEGFVGSVPGAIGDYTIIRQIEVLGAGWIDVGPIVDVSGDALISAVVLIGLTVALLIVGAYAFLDKELP